MKASRYLLIVLSAGIVFLVVFFLTKERRSPVNVQSTQSSAFPFKLLTAVEVDGEILRPPRLANNYAIVNSNEGGIFSVTYYAIESQKRDIAWKTQVSQHLGGWVETNWTHNENLMIVAGGNEIQALKLISGDVSWDVMGPSPITSISANENLVFVASNGTITAFDAKSGERVWQTVSLPGHALLVFYDDQFDRVIVPTSDVIYILDSTTGAITEEVTISIDDAWEVSCTSWFEQIIYYKDRVYCGPMAISVSTGKIISSKDFDFGEIWRPTINASTMYFRTFSGAIRAVNLESFTVLWEYGPEDGQDIISGVGIIENIGVSIADDGTLRAFDLSNGMELGWWKTPSGVKDWRKTFGGYSASTPIAGVASNGSELYVSFGDNWLYVFVPK